jgi:hypothetical protein
MMGVAVLQHPAECIIAEDLDLMSICINRHARLVCHDSQFRQDAPMLITTVQSAAAGSSCGVVVVVLRSIRNGRRTGLLAVQWLAHRKELAF